jgi:DNA-binding GntR family transcriptional regulator
MAVALRQTPPRDARRASLNELAYRRIRAAIARRASGSRQALSEGQLAKALGMSRTPVREALKRLAADGLVEIYPRRGTFVIVPGVAELREIFELRQALEGIAVRLSTPRVGRTELARLRARLHGTYHRNDAEALFKVGRALHALIIRRAGNRRLQDYLTTLRSQIHAMLVMGSGLPRQMELAYREYEAILDAMRDGDADRAEAAMRRHIMSVQQRLLHSMNGDHPGQGGAARIAAVTARA